MIEAHTLDAWTHVSARSTSAFGYLNILGGMAAPAFLLLAGVSAVLSVERASSATGPRWDRVQQVVRRGLEVFILAFIFRLQAFLVTPGSAMLALFRVDILNVLGPAVAVTSLAWGAGSSAIARVGVLGALAAAVTVSTPIVRGAAWVSVLPPWLQWYLRPAGEFTTFTGLPWVGFVFAGGAVGVLVAAVTRADARRHTVRWAALTASGALAVWCGFLTASMPSLLPGSSFWTTSPSFFLIRLGVLVAALGLAGLFEALWPAGQRWFAPLARLGRHSLFIYWIHVELVYGYLTWPLRKALPLPLLGVAYILFCLVIYRTLGVRDRLARMWQAWRSATATTPARAASA